MENHRIYTTSFASVYPHYITKAEKKGRTKGEVDEIICWLTGYGQKQLNGLLKNETDFETFFKVAPKMNPARAFNHRCNLRHPSRRHEKVDDTGDSLSR